MARQNINIGSTSNDGTGDTLRVAFNKINSMMTELYGGLGGDLTVIGSTITSPSSADLTLTSSGGSVIIEGIKVEGTTISSDDSTQINMNENINIDGDLTVTGTITGSVSISNVATFVGDDSTGTSITSGESFKFAGATGVTTAVSGDTLTITGPDLSSYATQAYVDARDIGDLSVTGSTISAPSNADLTLTTSGTGSVSVDGIQIKGTSISSTDSTQININENVNVDGNIVFTGSLTGDGSGLTGITATTVSTPFSVDNLNFDDNIISSDSNADIIVNPGGTGAIELQANTNIDGDATATTFIGDLRGPTIFQAKATEDITKGEAVYISGLSGNTPEVALARANSASTMPAFGIAAADIANTATGNIVTFGSCPGHDVSDFGETSITFALGDTVYVSSAEAGKLTNVAPTGESNLIQNIGKIERATPTTNMTIKVGGAGRTNATPALDDGNIFIGNGSNQSSTVSLATQIKSYTGLTVVGDDSTGTSLNIGETIKVAGASGVTTAVSGDTLTITGPGSTITGDITFTGSTISSPSNADITLTPGGTGAVDMGAIRIRDNHIEGTRSNETLEINTLGTGNINFNGNPSINHMTVEDGNVEMATVSSQTSKGNNSIAIGRDSGTTSQGANAIAIGPGNAVSNQGTNALAIGFGGAGHTSQGAQAIAIGGGAGRNNQGANSVAIGREAGYQNQHANTIVLSGYAGGQQLNTTQADSFYVKPVRQATGGRFLQYNADSGEITQSNTITSMSNEDISIQPGGTGNVVLGAINIAGSSITSTDSTQININENVDISGTLTVGGSTALTDITLNVVADDSATIALNNNGTLLFNGEQNITTSTDSSGVVTITGPDLSSYITASSSDTLTNKTIDANGTGNSITNLEVADFAAATIVTAAEGIGSNNNDTTIPTSAAVKAYADSVGGGSTGDLTITGSTISAPSNADLTLTTSGSGTVTASGGFTVTGGDTNTADLVVGGNLSVNFISSDDSTAVTVGDSLNVSGTFSANTIDTNVISSNDSSAIQINDDVNVSGFLSVSQIDTNMINSVDSSAIQINDSVNVSGGMTVAGGDLVTADISSSGNIDAVGFTATGNSTFDGVQITDNKVTSAASNANLELDASGTGGIIAQAPVTFNAGYIEKINTLTSSSTITVNCALASIHKVTLATNTEFNITNLPTGGSVTLIITQDGTGTRTATFGTDGSTAVKFSGGTPTLSTAASAIDVVTILNDGTNYLGNLAKAYAA